MFLLQSSVGTQLQQSALYNVLKKSNNFNKQLLFSILAASILRWIFHLVWKNLQNRFIIKLTPIYFHFSRQLRRNNFLALSAANDLSAVLKTARHELQINSYYNCYNISTCWKSNLCVNVTIRQWDVRKQHLFVSTTPLMKCCVKGNVWLRLSFGERNNNKVALWWFLCFRQGCHLGGIQGTSTFLELAVSKCLPYVSKSHSKLVEHLY